MMSVATILAGVSAHRISKGITYLFKESVVPPSPRQDKPLLLLLPWLGSRPQGVAKYCDIYFRTGCDVLIVESEASHFLWPLWSLDYGAEVLNVLNSDRFTSRPLLVHAFSIGAFTFTQLLIQESKTGEQGHKLKSRIKGHVYDSLVMGSLDRMAIGLGRTLLPQCESLVRHASLAYFRVFRKYTVDVFNVAVDFFWNHPITAPAVFFSCENDPLCDVHSMMEMMEYWQKQGVTVESKVWKDSTHAGHLKQHPEEYLATLENFLQAINITPLKAKM